MNPSLRATVTAVVVLVLALAGFWFAVETLPPQWEQDPVPDQPADGAGGPDGGVRWVPGEGGAGAAQAGPADGTTTAPVPQVSAPPQPTTGPDGRTPGTPTARPQVRFQARLVDGLTGTPVARVSGEADAGSMLYSPLKAGAISSEAAQAPAPVGRPTGPDGVFDGATATAGVVFRHPDFAPQLRWVGEGGDLGEVTLVPGRILDVVRLDEQGLPVPNHPLILDSNPYLVRQQAFTNDQGRARFQHLPAGLVRLHDAKAGPGGLTRGVDLYLSDPRTEVVLGGVPDGVVELTLRTGGTPLANATFDAHHVLGRTIATTDAAGILRLPGTPAGRLVLVQTWEVASTWALLDVPASGDLQATVEWPRSQVPLDLKLVGSGSEPSFTTVGYEIRPLGRTLVPPQEPAPSIRLLERLHNEASLWTKGSPVLPFVPTGRYDLVATAPGYLPHVVQGLPIEATTPAPDLTMVGGGTDLDVELGFAAEDVLHPRLICVECPDLPFPLARWVEGLRPRMKTSFGGLKPGLVAVVVYGYDGAQRERKEVILREGEPASLQFDVPAGDR